MNEATTDRPNRKPTDDNASQHNTAAPPGGDSPSTPPRCLRCHYILVGLPSDRCPECGTLIDWAAVRNATHHPPLPIERARGWRRWWGAVQTWALVLFHPRRTARSISEDTSTFWATVFALGCMGLAVGGHGLLSDFDRGALAGWVAGVWFHVECQSLLFLLLEFRAESWWRRWKMWRNVSLLTTAFVVLDIPAGPPLLGLPLTTANFPWPLDPSTWDPNKWWPLRNIDVGELLCGITYYWWMIVLTTIVWLRLRRKWVILVIVVTLPLVSAVSCELGAQLAQTTFS